MAETLETSQKEEIRKEEMRKEATFRKEKEQYEKPDYERIGYDKHESWFEDAPGFQKEKFVSVPLTESKKDPNRKMTAVEWHGNRTIKVTERPRPLITEERDVIIRVTTTTIGGSDLHLFHNEIQGMQTGDVLGQEFMGYIEDVGPLVKNFKAGDRVVVSSIIACGECSYCKQEQYACCDRTNPSRDVETLYGHRPAGHFAYSHLKGGYDGGQAEYARVPFADVNCLKVPDELIDEQVLFLSDAVCSGWHACEMANVSAEHSLVVWGCGPIGLMCVAWAKYRGAKMIIVIDNVESRLNLAKNRFGAIPVNFDEMDVLPTLRELIPGGPDICIDAAGFRFTDSLIHKLQRALRLESDSPSILNAAITCVKKGGMISVVGDYYSQCNNFMIGGFMEKCLTLKGGPVSVQKYWKNLLELIVKKEFDATFFVTHTLPLEQAVEAYELFDSKDQDAIKIVLKPSHKPAAGQFQTTE